MRGMIIVLFSILLFACNRKRHENASRHIQAKVVEAKGYVVRTDSKGLKLSYEVDTTLTSLVIHLQIKILREHLSLLDFAISSRFLTRILG
jgi:hypothetical protein